MPSARAVPGILRDDTRPKSAVRATSKGSHGVAGKDRTGGEPMRAAVVVTVTVAETSFVPSSVTEAEDTWQLAPKGAPLQPSDTCPVNPVKDEKVSV